MKIVYNKQGTYRFPQGRIAPLQFQFVSPRVTQIHAKDADAGGISQRGAGFRSIYAKNPVMIIYITPVNSSPWNLSNLQCRASLVTFDAYGSGEGNSQIQDIVNIDAGGLLATMGRFEFDLGQYAISEIKLDIRNRMQTRMQVKIRVEIYENI